MHGLEESESTKRDERRREPALRIAEAESLSHWPVLIDFKGESSVFLESRISALLRSTVWCNLCVQERWRE